MDGVLLEPAFSPAQTDLNQSLCDQIEAMQKQLQMLHDELECSRQRDRSMSCHVNRMTQELRLAARLQQDFLPRTLPTSGNIRFATMFRPAGYVSGDLFDVFRVDETHVGCYIADAVGHGVPAALLTIFLKTVLVTKEITPDGYRLLSPGETMTRLNHSLCAQKLSSSTFATAIYALIDVHTLSVRYARAGHPSPLIQRNGASHIEEPKAGDALLGIFPDEVYTTHELTLAAGDRLILHTDGIDNAFTGDINQDIATFRNHLRAGRGATAHRLVEDLSSKIDPQGNGLPDDVTVLVAQALHDE